MNSIAQEFEYEGQKMVVTADRMYGLIVCEHPGERYYIEETARVFRYYRAWQAEREAQRQADEQDAHERELREPVMA